MKNIDYIKLLPVEKLAEMLIKIEYRDDGDENKDGEWISFYNEKFVLPDGTSCDYYEDALEQAIVWLNEEHKKDN